MMVVLAVGAAVSQAASAGSNRGHMAASHRLGTLKIDLPPGGRGQIWELVLKVKAAQGGVGSLSARELDDNSLPPGVRAVAVISPVRSSHRVAKFKEFVAVNNLGGAAASASLGEITIAEYSSDADDGEVGMVLKPVTCQQAVELGNSVEYYDQNPTMYPDGSIRYGRYKLFRERPANVQPSSNESVLDNTIRAQCPGAPGVETTVEDPTSLQ